MAYRKLIMSLTENLVIGDVVNLGNTLEVTEDDTEQGTIRSAMSVV